MLTYLCRISRHVPVVPYPSVPEAAQTNYVVQLQDTLKFIRF